MAPVNNG